ncbi:MAG: DUF4136 domain-containing protein [Bacteroidia bacterium]
MKKNIFNYLFLIFILGVFGCGVYTSVYTDYDHGTNFSKYKTFALLPDSGMTAKKDSFENTAYDNDIIRNNAKNYIIRELDNRGLRVEINNPDILVQLVLLNEKQEHIVYTSFPFAPYYYNNPLYFPYFYPYYNDYTYYGWGCNGFYCDYIAPRYKETYVKGTITINMYDRKLKKLVWTGSAEGDIYDPDFIEDDIHPAIQRIMKTCPLRPSPDKSNMYSKG